MAGRTRGRRPKLNRDLEKRLLLLMRSGVPREIAAPGAGIASRTLRIWVERARDPTDPQNKHYADFIEKMEAAQCESQAGMIVDIRRHGRKDWRALAWVLERVNPERFGYKASVNMTVEGELEKILDAAGEVLGPEQASKLLQAITSRSSGPAELGQTPIEVPGEVVH